MAKMWLNRPEVKLEMMHEKWMLKIKAKHYNLSTEGTKLDLAIRIAQHESDMRSKDWEAISNGGALL